MIEIVHCVAVTGSNLQSFLFPWFAAAWHQVEAWTGCEFWWVPQSQLSLCYNALENIWLLGPGASPHSRNDLGTIQGESRHLCLYLSLCSSSCIQTGSDWPIALHPLVWLMQLSPWIPSTDIVSSTVESMMKDHPKKTTPCLILIFWKPSCVISKDQGPPVV